MGKILKIVFINLLFIFCIISFFEYKAAKRWVNNISFKTYINLIFKPIEVKDYYMSLYQNIVIDETWPLKFRVDKNIENIEKYSPILFMGCSFTYGDCLEENETVSYKFAKYTGRPVYNRAGSGWGLSQLLWQLSDDLLYKNIPVEPEYLIYIYIKDQIARIDKYRITPDTLNLSPKYKLHKGILTEEKSHFWDRFLLVQDFGYNYQYIFNRDRTEEIVQYFLQAEEEMRKHWKNTKFVIIKYPTEDETGDILANDAIFRKLKETGKFVILNANDITSLDLLNNKNRVKDKFHPAAHVWDDIVPNLAKALGIEEQEK